jgi:integrase
MPRGRRPHLTKRSDGRYRVKYKGKEFYGRSEDDAYDAMDAYIASLGTTQITAQCVSDYALPWLRLTYPAVKDSTYTGLAIHMQHLVDSIGDKKLSEVVPSDVKTIYSEHYTGLSNSYIRSAKQLYCSLFDSAMADGLIRFNPARDKAARPHRGAKVKERILSPDERQWITTLCVNHRAWPAVMTMLYAGLRPQEVKALDIDRDVDFETNIITVRETAHVDGQKYEFTDEMKTDWSLRKIPLFPPLKQALEGKHGYVITSSHGKPVTIQAWKSAWESYIFSMETAINGCQKRWYGKKKVHDGVELPPWKEFDIVPYTLRHAFCAFCRDSGVEINTCRRWMGHADAKMILKVYDSVSTDRSVNEAKKVEALLRGSERGSDENSDPSTR